MGRPKGGRLTFSNAPYVVLEKGIARPTTKEPKPRTIGVHLVGHVSVITLFAAANIGTAKTPMFFETIATDGPWWVETLFHAQYDSLAAAKLGHSRTVAAVLKLKLPRRRRD